MKAAVSARPGIWGRSHYLDKMSFRELVVAYFQHGAILAYLALALVAAGLYIWSPAPIEPTVIAIVAAAAAYPLGWYLIHRFILHGRWMYKIKPLASTWKRIHYDHHQDPNHLEVLFGALHTTLPTIAVVMLPIGYAIGGFGGAMIALATGLVTTCIYEFVHCIQHLKYKPRNRWVAQMKARHMAHHFHDEDGNYGITNYFWDKVFGTFYDRADRPEKSPTVFNLGYTAEQAGRYPWVAELSGGVATGHPAQRSRD